jgi:hypothetical protein
MTPSLQKIKVFSCEAMARPVYYYSALSPHQIDIELFRIGLHDHPLQLNQQLQQHIDQTPPETYDAIILVYGLCGRAIDGLKSTHTPIVVPKAHDCITMLLGSGEAYNQQQNEHPGTYWYSQDYLERSGRYGESMTLGSNIPADPQAVYQEYIIKYGQENADYLMRTLTSWQSHYTRAVLVQNELGVQKQIADKAEQEAIKRGWKLEILNGNLSIIKRLLFGEWDKDFLVVSKGSRIQMTMDENIITAIKFIN